VSVLTPLVSVVIPTFNRAPLVVKAVESVFAQTHKDYEVVVVDDGSTDNTREVLEPHRQRLRYVYQANRGASAAQNAGIDFAEGEWISILADDDEWHPTKLERQFEALDALGEGFDACFTNCHIIGNPDIQQTAFELVGLAMDPSFGVLDDPVRHMLARDAVICVQSLLVRKSLVKELGGFDEAMVVAEDTDFLLRLALKTKFCFVSEPLVRIDRDPSRVRLMDLFSVHSDKMFSSQEYMYRKWLTLPDFRDPELRAQTLETLHNLYLAWMIRKLYQFRFSEAFAKMRQGREVGDGYLRILSRLASRAARKVCF
jgi:glycosyltransferase involved in cell wall biosynthesis